MSDVITKEITGAKAGQQQPSRPSIADDTIASISRLKMIIGLSEGEVKGLANGAKSIMLEGTPLEDENGNRNFEGVEWEIRHGTVDQTYIAGMPNASSEIGVGVTIRSDTPWIRSINDTQLSSINVNISFPMLKKVTDKGDVVGVTVEYAIDVQTDGGGYVPVVTKSLTAKTSGRYQRTHNVTLPEAQSNWQIRVRKITTDGDNETLFNTMQIDSIAEIIDGKFNYPHTAHLYLSLDARTFSNIPKISVDMLGIYVQVPVNYDTETRTSTGIWNGQFKLGYTTNPAWHYYNLITNDRYGLGDKLQAFMIDKWALEHIARICDEPVDDGKGGTEPRFECNLYLQKSEDAYQVLQHIAGIFRGMSFWNGSKIFVDADTPRDCEYVITRANVIGGHFSKSGSAASDRHTIAQVAWSNPDNAYETEYAMVRNERAIAQQGINVLDLSAVGCTSEGQAYRMGLAALLAEQNRTQTVSFAMGLDGSLPTVGSRIDIPDMMFTGANNGGRISSVNANRTVITVDRDNVPATAGDKLIVNLESGKAQTRVITAINGRAITVALAFDPVAPENVWSVISDELPTMPFIVMSVTSAEDGTQYNYTALQYDPTMYAQIDNGTIIEQRPPVPSNNPYIIDAPDTVALGSRHRVAQGITVTTLEITWTQVKDAVAYDVEWRKDDGDWVKIARTGNISAEIDGVYSGNYLARVRAVSAFDAVSKPATSMLASIVGKVGAPPKLASLTATGLLFGMRIDWTFAPGSGDTAYTEIQVASAPDVNVAPLGQFAFNTDTHTINGLQGGLTQHYRGRIVDKLGNTSDWTSWISGTTDDSADKVLDLIQGQINKGSLNDILTSEIEDIKINKDAISKETHDRIQAIIDANKRIDGGIVDTDVEYYLSTSATIPTGGTWLTVAPPWQQSKYMFSRTKTTAANGNISYSPSANGTNITGAKGDKGGSGDKGDIGQGVDSIVEQYGVSRSKTDVPTTWTATAPVVTKGDYVWTRSKITYKDPVKVEYTNPIVSPAWAAISESNVEFINFKEKTTQDFGVQGEKLEGIIADYKPRYTDATKFTSESRSQQWTYWKTVAADNYASNERIERLKSDFNNSTADITNQIFTLAEKDKAISSSLFQLSSETSANKALIQEVQLTITTPNTGLAAKVTELETSIKTPDKLAALVEGSGVFSGDFGSISGKFTTMQGVVDGQKTAIETVSAVGNVEKLKNEIAKARLDKDITKLNAQTTALTNAVTSYDSKIAEITALRNATSDTALKAEYNKQITDLNTAKTDANAQKAVIADQVAQLNSEQAVLDSLVITEGKLKAQHSVRINAKNHVVGFGLTLDKDDFSEFGIDANSFYLGAPDGTLTKTFVHYSTAQNINGVIIPIGTYLRNAYIANGAITLAKIDTATITSLSALSATIGHFKSAPTGARLEIKDSLLSVYDANNTLRVRLGLW